MNSTGPRLNPPSNLIIGPAGTGKTTSIASLIECGLKVRMLATEPTAPARVLAALKAKGLPDADFHWQFISPSPPSWTALEASADMISRLSLDDIAKQKTGIAKSDARQWITFLKACAQFTSDRTGEIFGDCTEWGPDCVFAIDGLTGVNTMSRTLTVGLKPNPSPGEWGVMQNNILTLLGKLAADCKCFFVLIAHVERENNELSGVSNITVSTLGAKLAPKLPPLFTNVIYALRDGTNFYWSTASLGVDTKAGDLPVALNQVPSFKPIVEAYRDRLKAAGASPQAPAAPSSTVAS